MGLDSGPVREFFITNARYWIEEFHFDGFRFDATQSIFDKSEEHILSCDRQGGADCSRQTLDHSGRRKRAAGHKIDPP